MSSSPQASSGSDAPADTPSSQQDAASEPARLKPRRFVSYETALKYLDGRVNLETLSPRHIDRADFKLDRMRAMLELLDNPHHSLKCIHVAGSKGKGSIVEMVASSLSGCGYAPGVFTSPHLVSVRERIRVGDVVISQADFVKALGWAAAAASAVEGNHGPASYFELITLTAIVYFVSQVVDIAIFEVGLGGRLDSTNVICPEVSAIGAIHLEHTHILGSSLAEIAREKAGIIKPGVTTYTFDQDPEVMEVLEEVAQQRDARLVVIGKDLNFTSRFSADSKTKPHLKVCLTGEHTNHLHVPVPLPGHHQAVNCGLCLAMLDGLHTRGFPTDERPVAQGLAKTRRRGRLEVVHEQPRILIDGAHTAESIHALVKAVGTHYVYDSMVVIFGCNADKNVEGMIDKIGLGADKIIFTQCATNKRAVHPDRLRELYIERHGHMAQVIPDLKEAMQTAAKAVRQHDLILITGSFYLAGQAKALLLEAQAKRAARQQSAGPSPSSQIEPKP